MDSNNVDRIVRYAGDILKVILLYAIYTSLSGRPAPVASTPVYKKGKPDSTVYNTYNTYVNNYPKPDTTTAIDSAKPHATDDSLRTYTHVHTDSVTGTSVTTLDVVSGIMVHHEATLHSIRADITRVDTVFVPYCPPQKRRIGLSTILYAGTNGRGVFTLEPSLSLSSKSKVYAVKYDVINGVYSGGFGLTF